MIRTIAFPDRESWLNGRRGYVGSSDSPCLWACGYASQSRYALWSNKCHGTEIEFSRSEKLRLKKGVALEPIIRDAASEELGVVLQVDPPNSFRVNDNLPFMSSSLDSWYLDDDGLVVVELKWVSDSQRHEWEGDGPLKHVVQVTHHTAVADACRGILIGLCDDELMVRQVPRNMEFEAMHIQACRDFWRHVETKTPPEIDGSPATTEAIKSRWRREKGPRVEVGGWLDESAAKLEELKATAKQTKEQIDALENYIRDAIGEAEGCMSPSGIEFTWTTQERKEYTVAASSSRVLRRSKRKGK